MPTLPVVRQSLEQARPLVRRRLATEAWAIESIKGCSSHLAADPVSLIPPLNPLPRPDRPWAIAPHSSSPGQGAERDVDSPQLLSGGRVWFSLALHPDHAPRPRDYESFLRLLASARGGFVFEVVGGSDAVNLRIGMDGRDIPVLTVAARALHFRIGVGRPGEDRLPCGEPVMTEFVPRPPYADTFTRLDELPHPPVGLIVQTLRALPTGYTGCYQVCAQPVWDERWLNNIQSLHDHRFRVLKEPAGPEGIPQTASTQQIPSASLSRLTQETFEKNHTDRAYYFMLSRVAIWPPSPEVLPEGLEAANSEDGECHYNQRDLAYLQCMVTPVLAIRQNGRGMDTIPPERVVKELGHYQQLSSVLETGHVHRHGVLVNTDELASFVHLPSLDVIEQLGLDQLLREPLAPQETDSAGTGLGACIDGDDRTRVTIPQSMRCSHVHILGRTGFGKSTLLTTMVLDDVRRGDGVLVIDPHGQLVRDLADRLPPEAAERTRWLDFNDPAHAVLYNPLRAGGTSQIPAEIADDFIGGFKDMTSGWGDRLEHINRNIISAVAELPEGSLLEAMLSLERKSERGERTRQRLIEGCSDPLVRWFFRDHFKVYSNADLNPAHHKFSKLLNSGNASLCMRQPENRLDISQWMDRGEIVLVNLGSISREYKHILGSFLIANAFTAAQGRGHDREKRLKPFHLYIDECHRFSPALQSRMIAEVRKNAVSLNLAHQHLHQFPPEFRRGFGTAGTSLVFNVDSDDAESMARSLQGRVQGKQIMALRHFEAYARVGHEVVHLHTPHYTQLPHSTNMFEAIYDRSIHDWYVDRRLLEAQTNALIEGDTHSGGSVPTPSPTIPTEVLSDAPDWPYEPPPGSNPQPD